MKNFQIFFFAVVLLFSACRKDKLVPGVDFIPTGEEILIDSKLSGQVIDEAGMPIKGATVRIDQTEKITNEDGVFIFEKMSLIAEGHLVTIEKSGYYTNYKRVVSTGNQTFEKFGLVEKTISTGKFESIQGGTISKRDGEKIVFQRNSIVDESGNDYSGEVTVFTHHFNPEEPFLGATMPGDLAGINKQGTKVQLETYSMILVDLFGEAGQALNLKPGTTAAIEFPIKGAAAANAPEEIPLWSLDEITGLWVEEGKAIRQGDYYKGDVSHFSFWNCDVDFPVVNLEILVLDIDGNPLPHVYARIEIKNGGMIRGGSTNDIGIVKGGVPLNEVLILRVLNSCGGIVYTEDIGSFTSNQSIIVNVDLMQNSIIVTGSLTNCDRNPISEGYAVLKTDLGLREILPIDADGNLMSTVIICNASELTFYGVDQTTFTKSPDVIVNYTGQPNIGLNALKACDDLDEFYKITLKGNEHFFDTPTSTFNGELFLVRYGNGQDYSQIALINPILGTNTPIDATVSLEFSPYQICAADLIGSLCFGHFSVEMNRLDTVAGGYVEGIGTGELWENGTDLVPVTIEFRVKLFEVMTKYSGVVSDDMNKNGIRDSGEPGIENVMIRYNYEGIDGRINSNRATTDQDGNYSISVLKSGLGELLIPDPPTGYVITSQNQGSDESIDSDFDPITRRILIQDIDLSATNQADCGLYIQ